jgi:hypothetical protein
MKWESGTAAAVTVLALLFGAAGALGQAHDLDEEPQDEWALASPAPLWPYRFDVEGEAFTVYPPQLERWSGGRLEGRAAVAVQSRGADKPVFGIVSLTAHTEVDEGSGTVIVRDINAASGSFPTAPDRTFGYLEAVRSRLSTITWQVPVERLRADLAIEQSAWRSQNQPLRNDPPRIVYSQSPAILVLIDGEPVLREMPGLGLQRVLNTRALVLREAMTGRYFLSAAGYWLEAAALDGPWQLARVRPMAVEEAKRLAQEQGEADLLEDGDAAVERAPRIIVSSAPAELVQTDGPPEYLPIPYTQLLYVANSPNQLFLDPSSGQHYALLAGRWYRTHSLHEGPWEYVPGNGMPADFARIPDTHPSASVRAAVAGTAQAQEAAIANSAPEVATVKRSAARLEVAFDGPPQFRPIEGTTLEWAVNAPIPVIRVDWRSFYALDNGVWFFADSPEGPWTAAAWVPAVVYTIPRNHPLHYVTYVRVYDSTEEEVTVGYTPGYAGSFVTADSTVVYGSGWHYRPWIGSRWYAPHTTWGFGFSVWHSWWDPWPWHFKRLAWRPYPCFRPWWGPWHHHRIVAARHVVVKPAARSVIVAGSRPAKKVAPPAWPDVGHIYHRWGRHAVIAKSPATIPAGAIPSGVIHSPRAHVPPQRFGVVAPLQRPGASFDRPFPRARDGLGPRFDRNGRPDSVRPGWADSPHSPRPDRPMLAPTPGPAHAPAARTGGQISASPRAAQEPRREFPRARNVRPDWQPPRAAVSAPAPSLPRAIWPGFQSGRGPRAAPTQSLREASPPPVQAPAHAGRNGRAHAQSPELRAGRQPWVGQQRN